MTRHRLRSRLWAASLVLCAGFAVSGCGLVVHAGDYETQECATNGDCLAGRGANFVCRATDKTCQNLITPDCQEVIGAENLKDDSTFLLGAMFALKGANAPTGRVELAALQMAFRDFAAAGGLPPLVGQSRRQMAVLVCDDSASNDVMLRAGQHMIGVGIQSIMGFSWSGPTINFLNKAGLAARVLSLASGTTSPDLTGLQKNGLFYRTVESTALENPPTAALVEALEGALVKARPGLNGTTRLALAYKGDSYGKGTVQSLVPLLKLNGRNAADPSNATNFVQISYGNPADPNADPLRYGETATRIGALQPQIIVTIGTGEMFANVMTLVEQQWPTGAGAPPRPYYVYNHSGVSSALLEQLKTDPTGDLRKRIVGITFGSVTTTFTQFLNNFYATQPADISPYTQFANTTYDAFYTLAYSAVSLGGRSLTGPNLGTGFANLVAAPGRTKIKVGPQDLNQALTLLSSGQPVDLEGTSGALDFDLNTGDVAQENQVWCVPLGKDGNPAFPPFSGYGFDLTGTPTGGLENLKDACGIVIQ